MGEPTCLPCDDVPFHWNKPQEIYTVVLKWVNTRGQNPRHF